MMKKTNEMAVFQNDQFGSVRVIEREGEPWFVAADVCRALEITNPSVALERLDDDEKMTLSSTEGHSGQRGGAQLLNIVNEPGMQRSKPGRQSLVGKRHGGLLFCFP